MKKMIELRMNKFPVIPNDLRKDPKKNIPVTNVDVNIAELCHHMYIDSHGEVSTDSYLFQHYKSLITNDGYLRFKGNGLGSHTEARRYESNIWGKAICRWFLYKYFNITFFAHMDHILDKEVISKAFGSLHVERSAKGDTPDYFCAESVNKFFIAEAKGRRWGSNIDFSSESFKKFRDQFKRINVKDNSGVSVSIKGFIVATKFANEENQKKRSFPIIFAEDPRSKGEIREQYSEDFGRMIISSHFATILDKIELHPLSEALKLDFLLPKGQTMVIQIWECTFLEGVEFVGNVIPKLFFPSISEVMLNTLFIKDSKSLTFFGLELGVLKKLLEVGKKGREYIDELLLYHDIDSSLPISFLRDGTLLSPIHYMKFKEYRVIEI